MSLWLKEKTFIPLKSLELNDSIFLFFIFLLFFIICLLLVIRIGFIQFVQGSDLKESATKNQLATKTIAASRGTIYDSTGKALAVSAHVDTVTINPSQVEYSDGTEVNKEILAHAFSDIFDLDYEETLEKINTAKKSFVIASKVENDKITALQEWMKNNKVTSGISIDDDIKRYVNDITYKNELLDTPSFKIDKEKIQNFLNSVLAGNYNEKTTKEELFEYFKVVREYGINQEIKRLTNLMKKEVDPLEQAKIVEKIRKLRIGE